MTVVAVDGRWGGGVIAKASVVMHIETVGAAPVVSRVDYVNGSYTLRGLDEYLTGTLRIRGRGHSTWDLEKKPYRLNFDVAIAPLGMTATQKNWALLANHLDPSKIRNAFAFTVGQAMDGLEWTPQFRPLEVYLNGDYLGLYQITDLVRVEAGRLSLTKATGTTGLALTGGYLLERDLHYLVTGDPGFTTPRATTIAFDDPDGTSATQAAYLQDWIEDFEDRLFAGSWLDPVEGYAARLDVDSFVDWYWVNELVKTWDAPQDLSGKCYKKRDAPGVPGRLFGGPLWDFDLSFGMRWSVEDGSAPTNSLAPEGWHVRESEFPEGWYEEHVAVWTPRMFEDPAFSAAVEARWATLAAVLDDLDPEAWIDAQIADVAEAMQRDATRWDYELDVTQEAATAKAWISDRITWIAAEMA